MKITMYELLGMVKDGKAPKKIKYSGIEYEFNGKDYINEFGVNLLQHLTYAECIKEQHNIGETIYHNICNNETNKITWGSDTWVGVVILFIIFVLIIITLIKGIFEF